MHSIRFISIVITLLLLCSCPPTPLYNHSLHGVNLTEGDIYFFANEEYEKYIKEYPKTSPQQFISLTGFAKACGGRQRIVAGELDSWKSIIKSDSLIVHIISDSLIDRYGLDIVLRPQNTIMNAEYRIPLSYMDSLRKTISFPPKEYMREKVKMWPSYEEIIAKFSNSK